MILGFAPPSDAFVGDIGDSALPCVAFELSISIIVYQVDKKFQIIFSRLG